MGFLIDLETEYIRWVHPYCTRGLDGIFLDQSKNPSFFIWSQGGRQTKEMKLREHKHVIIRAYVNNPPKDADRLSDWCKEVVAAVITKHFPDNRRVLNELQRYSVSGVIDKGILSNVTDVQLGELVKSLREKDFASARKWVTNNLDNDPARIFRKLYDTLQEHLKPQGVPQLVLILAKYQYQAAFVADHEINLIACLTEIMVDCEFK